MSFDKYDSEGKVICQECGKSFNLLAHAHMKKHNMTVPEYKDKYPDYPVSSERFRTSQKFRTADVFKEAEEPKPLSKKDLLLLDKEDLDKVDPSEIADNEEPIPVYVRPDINDILTKEQVGEYLTHVYPNVIVNFIIKKFTLGGLLEYYFATDMVDVATRTVFDFPNTWWHTGEFRPNANKERILITDGWKIVKILQDKPTIKDIKNILDIID